MKIIITKANNGIHSYLKTDIEDVDGEDLTIISDIQEVVNKYNREQVEKA